MSPTSEVRTVSTQAMERREGGHRTSKGPRSGSRARLPALALALKRLVDVVLALAMLIALLPVLLLVVGLLLFAGDGRWIEKRQRLGRNGRTVSARALPRAPGWLRRARARARGRA